MNDSVNLRHKDWDSLSDEQKDMVREGMRNWRSWGSWFSWGSPVGLGIWLVLTAAAFWIVMHALH